MKPAVSSKRKAFMWAIPVAGFALWWYSRPFAWLGICTALLTGLFIFFILRTAHLETFRRIFYIGLFGISIITLAIIIADMDLSSFLNWASGHVKGYYLSGQYLGSSSYPCTRQLAQVILRRAEYLPELSVWQTTFPATLNDFLILMIPFAVTGVIFGRSFCGWICPFGGLPELMVTGKKERWHLDFLRNQEHSSQGMHYTGLKAWVKDIKYGVLLAIVLMSIFLSFPIVCVYCPVLWLSSKYVFWTVISILVLFAIVFPFMTKKRWWCQVCPVGAVASLLDKISVFRIRINKIKCTECADCIQECRVYAMTEKAITTNGRPDADCIRCGRCIEACPEGAVDSYLFNTSLKSRALFITFAIGASLAWYAWFVFIFAEKLYHLVR
jgi:polyferredoxin